MDSSGTVNAFVGRSVMLEMNTALSAICGYHSERELPAALAEAIQKVPDDLRGGLREILGGRRRIFSFLEYASVLGDVLVEDDYDKASLALRSLTVDNALVSLRQKTAAYVLPVPEKSHSRKELSEMIAKTQLGLYDLLGRKVSSRREAIIKDEAELTVSILAGGERHQRFWMLLDRLYYQYWHHFRSGRLDRMRLVEDAVGRVLSKQPLVPQNLGWLPSHNPLVVQEGLLEAALQIGMRIFLWSEPIGLPDTWFVTPEFIGVSFAESGEIMQAYRHFAEDIARRVAALSDPSRLVILRLIREFGMYNTGIASFLNLSRPTVSNHAKILREAGLITSRQEGNKTVHEICEGELAVLFEDLKRFLDLNV